MKFINSLVFSLFLFISSSMAQKSYVINMKLTGFNDGTKFKLLNLDSDKFIDSSSVQNGVVTMRGNVTMPFAGRIHTIDGKYLVVYIENKSLRIIGTYKDFEYSKIEGSEINRYSTKSRDAQKRDMQTRDSLMQIVMSLSAADSLKQTQIIHMVMHIDSITIQYRKTFIKNEKPTYFTMKELFFLRNDYPIEDLKATFIKFPKNLQMTKDGLVVSSYIENKNIKIGQHFVDMEGLDQSGIKHKLSDFKGQYVLLEFWASWCGPCRQENPATLQTYNKYHEKGFQIFGFSVDADKESWMAAVKKDNLSWLNVTDLKGNFSLEAAKYQVRAIPQNFLIDPNGIIIAKDLRGEALANQLNLIYKKHSN